MNITRIEFTTPENERAIMVEYHRAQLYRDWYEHHQNWAEYERQLAWTRMISAAKAFVISAAGVGIMIWLAWGLAR